MKLLFLDIDGVLNAHKSHPNGYCGIIDSARAQFNRVMDMCPDVQVVVSSAWRYHVHNGEMNLKGLEELLLTHGLSVKDRIHGITDRDDAPPMGHWTEKTKEWWSEQGLKWRKQQIHDYVNGHKPAKWVVIDDLALDMPELVRTDADSGMNELHSIEIIERFGVEIPGIGKCMECGFRLPLKPYATGSTHMICAGCTERIQRSPRSKANHPGGVSGMRYTRCPECGEGVYLATNIHTRELKMIDAGPTIFIVRSSESGATECRVAPVIPEGGYYGVDHMMKCPKAFFGDLRAKYGEETPHA